MKKTIIITITSILIGFIILIGVNNNENREENKFTPLNYNSSILDNNPVSNNTYKAFVDERESVFPDNEYDVDLRNYEYKNGLFEDDVPYFDYFLDKEGIYIPETGDITFNVEVDNSGLYNLNLDYFSIEGRGASIIKGILINDEFQYSELENININRYYIDEFDFTEDRTKGMNDLRPSQIEEHKWTNYYIADHLGYYNDPYYFWFEEGVNKITFISYREPIVINNLKLTQAKTTVSYEEYFNKYSSEGAKIIEDDFLYEIEAEESLYKTSPSLVPIAEYSTYKFSPYERHITRYNAIGGMNWRIPGDEIGWEVEVPEDGFYNVTFKFLQNFSRGQKVSRVLKVNGEIPFKEAENIEFGYNSDLRYLNIGKDNQIYVHFKKGVNTISLTSSVGIYGSAIQQTNINIQNLRDLYREIVMRTGLNPDPLQDYQLNKHVKNLDERLINTKDSLEQIKNDIIEISKGRNSLVSAFDRIIYQLDRFLKDDKNIQKGLREFEQNIAGLGSWVMNVSEQPLTIDSIFIHGNETKLKRVSTNFFERIWHEIIMFIGAFKNTGDFGSSIEVDGPTIDVWIGTGRDQATIIRQLIDESFIRKNNINVNLKLVNMSVLLPATLSGNGPDVAIGVDQKLPVNWGIRNAIKDLTLFPDFEEVSKQFSESAMTPLGYDGKVYALPDTEDFLIMFYREDILNEVGINTLPTTWEEVIDISPQLQKQHLDFYIPLVQGTLSPVLYSMISQNEGSLYLDDGRESGMLEQGSLEAFLNFTRFYTDYGFVLEADFINRFRSGEMPIGITNFTAYNTLSVFAPEIQSQWDYAKYPGTLNEDGELLNQTTSSVTASIILEHTKEEEASWKFLKWWLSEDVQIAYARGMEGILGAAARYPTANLNAFTKLPWPAKDYLILKEQRENAVGIPTVPGDYIVGRYIDNAFRQTLNDNLIPQDSIYQYHLKINEELLRKRKELGLA